MTNQPPHRCAVHSPDTSGSYCLRCGADLKGVSLIDRLEGWEAPLRGELRRICQQIGYGRVIQLAEDWMEEIHPGWKAARRACIMEGTIK